MKTPTLETARLILRPISLDDAESLHRHFNNWNIIKYLSDAVPWPYPDNATHEWLTEKTLPGIKKGEDIVWVLCPKEGIEKGKAIGNIHYRLAGQIKDSDRGFWISEDYQRNGLMSEVVCATQDYMFFEYGLKSFYVANAQSNIGSRKLKEKFGARFLRTEAKPCGRIEEPTEIWEITKESWARAKRNLNL